MRLLWGIDMIDDRRAHGGIFGALGRWTGGVGGSPGVRMGSIRASII